jgi:ATP-dependent DNA ligase
MPKLPAIRYSDGFAVTAEEMVAAVRSQGLEGVVAKRRESRYEPGQRSGARVKMRIGGGQEFVIAGYTPSPKTFDALLVGYYDGDKLIFVARVRNGFVPKIRETVFRHFKSLRSNKCSFSNLPESKKGRWGEGLTAADMKKCIWLKPELVAALEYAERTPANHLRPFRICDSAGRERSETSETRTGRRCEQMNLEDLGAVLDHWKGSLFE